MNVASSTHNRRRDVSRHLRDSRGREPGGDGLRLSPTRRSPDSSRSCRWLRPVVETSPGAKPESALAARIPARASRFTDRSARSEITRGSNRRTDEPPTRRAGSRSHLRRGPTVRPRVATHRDRPRRPRRSADRPRINSPFFSESAALDARRVEGGFADRARQNADLMRERPPSRRGGLPPGPSRGA
jgi:hypothetical protein